VLTVHRDQPERVAVELLAREALDGAEFYRLVGMPHPKEAGVAVPVAGTVSAAKASDKSQGQG